MKKKKIALPAILLLLSAVLTFAANAKIKSSYFQITAYHYSTSEQEALIDGFLKEAYLPALHKKGINNVGCFKPITNDTAADKMIYVIRSFKNIEQLAKIDNILWNVESFGSQGDAYLNADYNKPAYTRIENIILISFDVAPMLTLPTLKSPKSEHIYELRSYEAASEKLHNNKVHMFNQGGETTLFTRLNFNPVFYGKVLAGSKMPNLMYMTSFENREERDAHWKAFSADPQWKKLSSMPEYQHNMSKADIILMKATDYSDF